MPKHMRYLWGTGYQMRRLYTGFVDWHSLTDWAEHYEKVNGHS